MPRIPRQARFGVALVAATLAVAGIAASPAQAATTKQQTFINSVYPGAQTSQIESGIPASVTLAQAILESGWGGSTLSKSPYNNLFGIKCGTSEYSTGCADFSTTECNSSGDCWKEVASFRTYASISDSVIDHQEFLVGKKRYSECFKYVNDPDQFARELQKAGYATDPSYANKLISLMEQYDLYQYNQGAWGLPEIGEVTAVTPPVAAAKVSTLTTQEASPSEDEATASAMDETSDLTGDEATNPAEAALTAESATVPAEDENTAAAQPEEAVNPSESADDQEIHTAETVE